MINFIIETFNKKNNKCTANLQQVQVSSLNYPSLVKNISPCDEEENSISLNTKENINLNNNVNTSNNSVSKIS
jgi:hypothetical protein